MRRALLCLLLAAACAPADAKPKLRPAPPPVADGIPLGTLPRQALPRGQCALFLWKVGDAARLLLKATADPPTARIVLDGKPVDLPRTGTGATTTYSNGATTIVLDVAMEERRGLTGGAVSNGTLRLDRAGADGIVVPVSGLLGCN